MFRTSYEPSGIVISVIFAEIKFVYVQYRVISLKNCKTKLVIAVTQTYGGKIVRREETSSHSV